MDNLTFGQQVIVQIVIGIFIVGASAGAAYYNLHRVHSQNSKDDSEGNLATAQSVKILLDPLNARIVALEKQIAQMNGVYHISMDLQVGETPSARVISVVKAGTMNDNVLTQ